ncbi:uncharacterized protein LOC132181728 [Corylus avellana]|uniref:uncharacterized protein LOC132181728 n=1 Tax=Corylus avellana TaxID=13451 RepID=UPI00286A6EDA|nr:uncharacterized protein LOC132181728 [Corylus avellana]
MDGGPLKGPVGPKVADLVAILAQHIAMGNKGPPAKKREQATSEENMKPESLGLGEDCARLEESDGKVKRGKGEVRELCRMVKEKRPKLVFLMETKLPIQRMERIKVQAGFESNFVVNNVGRSGGLALLWNEDIGVEIQNYSRRHIDAIVKLEGNGIEWKFTGFFGHPEVGKRQEAWSLLWHLSSFSPAAWLCVGDFNEVKEDAEKFGKVPKPRWQMEAFRETLNFCHLQDLGYSGAKYTWCNMKLGDNLVMERLDRATATSGWRDIFPVMNMEVLANRNLDHTPLLLTFSKPVWRWRRRKIKFRYEAEWSADKECQKIITEVWNTKLSRIREWRAIRQKLEESKLGLKKWAEVNKPPIEGLIDSKTRELQQIQCAEGNLDVEKVGQLQREVNTLIEQNDTHLRQRAKVAWLTSGDRNSAYFHACFN